MFLKKKSALKYSNPLHPKDCNLENTNFSALEFFLHHEETVRGCSVEEPEYGKWKLFFFFWGGGYYRFPEGNLFNTYFLSEAVLIIFFGAA